MAENMIKFLRGNVANLPQTATAGALYFTKDEGVYLGLADGSYHRYGDFITVSDVASLPAAGAHQNCMYYCVAENILAKWDGKLKQWVQINKQKTLAELGGVAKSAYDTKMDALEKADSDNATAISNLNDYVGTIPDTATAQNIVAYVQEKTSGIATNAALTELSGKVSTAEGEIDALQAAIADGGSVTQAIAAAKKAGTDAQADVDALEGKVGTVADGTTVVGLITDAKTQADKGVSDAATAKAAADAAQADVNALEAKVGDVPADKNVVGMIGDVDAAYKAADTALAGRISTIEGDYLKAADKTALETAIGKKVDQTAYDAKVSALETDDETLQTNIDNEAKARKDADDAQVKRIATLEGQITGLSGAMHFEGVKDSVPADVSGYESGDVIIVGEKEYVFNGTKFVEFGDVSAEGDRIAALEGTVGKAAEGEKPATGLIKDIADNTAAITAEANRAKAAESANASAAAAAKDAADAAQAAVDVIKVDYLKTSDKNTLQSNIDAVSGRVTTLEGVSHTHTNKALLDTYTQTEADLADAVAKKHSHANATELDKIKDGDVAKWNAAQNNAEANAATALSSAKTELEDKITAAQTAAEGKVTALANGAVKTNTDNITTLQSDKADKATTLAGYGITDAYTKTETYTKAEVQALLQWDEF